MRRWNGWGDETITYPVPASAADYLTRHLGKLTPYPDASMEAVLASVPTPRLSAHPLVQTGPQERLLHARGQSLPDWIALRYGCIPAFPDGVAYPTQDREIYQLYDYARDVGAQLIPYGGGTSVVGHINPLPGNAPVLTLDLSHMNRLLTLDETSLLATFEAGVMGPALEQQLNRRGYTLGHFPQSFELSTLGGWIASRSSGQQSYHYGRIEDLFAGGQIETRRGPLHIRAVPASAAGPDLRHLVLGSEGRLGVITQATVRIRRLPEAEEFYGVFFHDWHSGATAVRDVVQAGIPVSMLRLSDAAETETTMILSGKERLVTLAKGGLGLLRYGPERCLLVYGVTGQRRDNACTRATAEAIFRLHGGLPTGTTIGRIWRKSRFYTPYLRNTLWEKGVAVDTLETAMPWNKVEEGAAATKAAIVRAAEGCGEKVLVFSHLSHLYPDGASFYITFLFRRTADPDELHQRWLAMKSAASQVILAQGGTISHQHGIGSDHAPYLEAEKGPVGMELIRAALKELDPEGMLNPGKLVEKPGYPTL